MHISKQEAKYINRVPVLDDKQVDELMLFNNPTFEEKWYLRILKKATHQRNRCFLMVKMNMNEEYKWLSAFESLGRYGIPDFIKWQID